MKRLLLAMLGLLLAGVALAGVRSTRDSVEASMVVTGTIGITPQGTVLGYTLDAPEKLPPVVVGVIGKSVPTWSFKPVLRDGKAVAAKTKMTLRLVVSPLGEGKFEVAVRGAYFGDESLVIKQVKLVPPQYPRQALRERLDGTVYLALRVDRAGNVADAIAQQVNLRAIGGESKLQQWRKLLADASVKAARQWTFTPADASDHEPYRVVRIPVAYAIGGPDKLRKPVYGQWETYVPGPVEFAPWIDADTPLASGADALPGDGIYGQSELSLLTPLGRS